MRVFLTGGTGFIGTATLAQLVAAGHEVTALARSDDSAAAVEKAGATAVRGGLADVTVIAAAALQADATIHLASPSDETSASLDEGIVQAVLAALAGTGKTYLHTSGCWIYGSTDGVGDETGPLQPPAITGWRLPIEATVRAAAATDVRAIVIGPGVVHGRGGGLPTFLTGAPQDADGNLLYLTPGDQHWSTVHVDDIAALYVLALTNGSAGEYYLGVADEHPTTREIAEAVARHRGLPGVAPESLEDSNNRINPYLVEALQLDQRLTGAKARAELGWTPSGPSLLEEIATGAYDA